MYSNKQGLVCPNCYCSVSDETNLCPNCGFNLKDFFNDFLDEQSSKIFTLIEEIPLNNNAVNYIGKIKIINNLLEKNPGVKSRVKNIEKLDQIKSIISREKKRLEKLREQEERQSTVKHQEEKRLQEAAKIKEQEESIKPFEDKYLHKKICFEDGVSSREGVIVNIRFKDAHSAYASVSFADKQEKKEWVIPDSIERGDISLENKLEPKKESDMSYIEKETLNEKKYLLAVIDACTPYIKKEYEAVPVNVHYYNPDDDGFNPQEVANKMHTNYMQDLWRKTSMSPFFASVKSSEYGLLYIGKSGIDSLVVDWRDPKCNIYYNFTTILGNKKVGISLVRDHDIAFRKYKGFVDRFNTEYSVDENTDGVNLSNLNDKYLLNLLESSRKENRTHDIIQTIQDNQYRIISNTEQKNLLVTGCAGSGKTMVIFHRIAFLAFNDLSFKPEEFLVLSSNKLLNDEAIELSKELRLEAIKNIDSYGFYHDFIRDYIVSTSSNFDLNDEHEGYAKNGYAYSYEYLENTFEKIKNFSTMNDKDFYNYFYQKIVNASKHILKTKINNVSDIKNIVSKNEHIFDLLKNVPSRNLIELSQANEDHSFVLKYLKKYLGNFYIKRADGEPYKNMSGIPSYIKLKNYTETSEIHYGKISYFNRALKYKNENFLYIYDLCLLLKMATHFIDYIEGKYQSLFLEIVDYAISSVKEFALSNRSDKLFIYAYLLGKIGFSTKNNYKRVFVDEFQNYSKAELLFLKSLTENGSLNLFGDVRQKIDNKGIDYKTIDDFGAFNKFELTVNYRNAKEICLYLNEKFKTNMIPIGLSGKVEEKNIKIKNLSKLNLNDRTAVIVKEINEKNFKADKFNIINSNNKKIDRSLINVVSVQNVRGIEFEEVFVIEKGMSENEKYLAYSRALNSLTVLKK